MDERFVTTDIYLAGVLFAEGMAYTGLEAVENDWKDRFVFDRAEPELLAGWQNGSLKVSALAFANALRKLKRDVKQHQREKENRRV